MNYNFYKDKIQSCLFKAAFFMLAALINAGQSPVKNEIFKSKCFKKVLILLTLI